MSIASEPDFRGNEALVPEKMSALVPEEMSALVPEKMSALVPKKMSDGALFPGSGKELFEISRLGKSCV